MVDPLLFPESINLVVTSATLNTKKFAIEAVDPKTHNSFTFVDTFERDGTGLGEVDLVKIYNAECGWVGCVLSQRDKDIEMDTGSILYAKALKDLKRILSKAPEAVREAKKGSEADEEGSVDFCSRDFFGCLLPDSDRFEYGNNSGVGVSELNARLTERSSFEEEFRVDKTAFTSVEVKNCNFQTNAKSGSTSCSEGVGLKINGLRFSEDENPYTSRNDRPVIVINGLNGKWGELSQELLNLIGAITAAAL